MSRSSSLLSALLVAGLAPSLLAQEPLCFGPDGLNTGCCMPAGLNLPAFPALTMNGLAPTWASCQVQGQPSVQVRMAAPVPSQRCGELTAQLEIINNANGNTVLSGQLVLDYTRTFGETVNADAAPEYQVWRFAAKVDLAVGAAFGSTPSCLNNNPHAFYYGYVDYAASCAGAVPEGVLVLFHGCDKFVHDAALSAVPGAFHPGISYALVAPSSAANPFSVQNLPLVGGVPQGDGMRTLPSPFVPCASEEPVSSGNLTPLGQGCACAVVPGPGQQSASRFAGLGSCPDLAGNPSSWQALNGRPLGLPWVRMITTSIGRWTTANSYPGQEQAAVSEGLFSYHESCANGGQGVSFTDLFYGATTAGGFDQVVVGGAGQPLGMIDLASNYDLAAGGVPVGPYLGKVLSTRHLIYTNLY